VPSDIIMPQMGESITEGTITKWRVAVGDTVERDDPLFDIATDKVDTEVPAALTGRLVEILVPEGETVTVNTVVGRIAAEGEVWSPDEPQEPAGEPTPAGAPETDDGGVEAASEALAPSLDGEGARAESVRRQPRSSPLVRRMAREHGVDLASIPGTGEGGRVSKQDMLAFLEGRDAVQAETAAPAAPPEPAAVEPLPAPAAPPAETSDDVPTPALVPAEPFPEVPEASESDRTEPLSHMRRSIADHMIRSRRTSAHVTTVFEVDVSRVVAVRAANGAAFEERAGVRLTLMPFFAQATIDALGEFPVLNASLGDDHVVYHRNVNLGIAVALPDGLIVPVLARADERNFMGLARGITDLAKRARTGGLTPDEVQGGTFTITNPGPFGALFGTPIIAQPQVAILGVGGVHKRPVVVDGDAIAVRSMVFLALSFDHRLIDGAVADQFMAAVKSRLENWPEGDLRP
jgi:pyruvate dehydrogenase E2 component (dihydrolipoamide acetyltransferase)